MPIMSHSNILKFNRSNFQLNGIEKINSDFAFISFPRISDVNLMNKNQFKIR